MYWMEWISYLNRKRPKPGSILDQYQSQTTTPAKRVESEEGERKIPISTLLRAYRRPSCDLPSYQHLYRCLYL